MKYFIYPLIILSLVFLGCEKQTEQSEEITMTEETIAKFVPTELKYDSSNLDIDGLMGIIKDQNYTIVGISACSNDHIWLQELARASCKIRPVQCLYADRYLLPSL